MPAFQSLKLLPTQCATTQSPTASPIIRLHRHRRRRRKTLRMLLLDRRHQDPPEITDKEIGIRVRHKLKDLLVSSPPPPTGDDKRRREGERKVREALLPAVSVSGSVGFRFRTVAFATALGPVSSAFRHRLLRRAWRPVLLTIPE